MNSHAHRAAADSEPGDQQEHTAHISPEQISKLKAECSEESADSGNSSLSPMVARIPTEVSESFTMVCELGTGTTATVFLAIDHRATGRERYVAVKRFLPELTERELFTELFIEELQNAVSVDHPSASRVSDFGKTGASYYMAMEYLQGETLERLQAAPAMREVASRSPRIIARIFATLAQGVHAMHSLHNEYGPNEAIHRDINPRNLFVLYDGSVRVADFGTAWTRDMGKYRTDLKTNSDLSCWAPEQLDHVSLDSRVDVWALGVVLWEALAGQKLFRCHTEREAAVEITARRVPPPSELNPQVPPELDRIVLRALTRNRDKRQSSALKLAAELADYLASSGEPITESEIAAWVTSLAPAGIERSANLLELAQAVDERESGTDVADADYLPADQDEPEHTTHIFTGKLSNTLRSMERLPFDAAPMEAVSFKDAPLTQRTARKPPKRVLKRAWHSGILPFATPIAITLLGIGIWQAVTPRHATHTNKASAAQAAPLAPKLAATATPTMGAALPAVTRRDEKAPAPTEKFAAQPMLAAAPHGSAKPASSAKAALPGSVFVTTPGGGDVYDQGALLGHAPRLFELSPGSHTLVIKAGDDTRSATVLVPAGASIVVSVPPTPVKASPPAAEANAAAPTAAAAP